MFQRDLWKWLFHFKRAPQSNRFCLKMLGTPHAPFSGFSSFSPNNILYISYIFPLHIAIRLETQDFKNLSDLGIEHGSQLCLVHSKDVRFGLPDGLVGGHLLWGWISIIRLPLVGSVSQFRLPRFQLFLRSTHDILVVSSYLWSSDVKFNCFS